MFRADFHVDCWLPCNVAVGVLVRGSPCLVIRVEVHPHYVGGGADAYGAEGGEVQPLWYTFGAIPVVPSELLYEDVRLRSVDGLRGRR